MDNAFADRVLDARSPYEGALRSVPLRIGWILKRINPKNLVISPVHGDLSNLPPVLAHANEVEMLLDDSRLSGQAADAEPRRSCVAHLQPRVA